MENKKLEHSKFKKLLEYFVAHLEWVVTNNNKSKGFDEFILPLIEQKKFKRSGQGYSGKNIQLQISNWESYTHGKICINIQANFGNYKSAKSYLNWFGTGLNIIVSWSEDKITSLYQEEYLHWEENPTRKKFGKNFSLADLGLFDKKETVTLELIDFFESFEKSIIAFNKFNTKKKMTSKLEPYINLVNYKKQIILQGPPGTGKTKKAKELAVEILHLEDIKKLNDSEQFKLIQFHPSYTYEDFVRGIVSKPNENGEGVLFKTENKILAEFADKAYKNLILSQEDNSIALQDKWIEETFEEFKAEIEEKIEQTDLILSGTISVFNVAEDCFRYGKDWQNPSRINFIDFKVLIKAVIYSGFDVNQNDIPKILSIHAHYRFTYYLALLRLFFKKHEYKPSEEKVLAKKYVLVIDEINRANLPSVLGELIYALEYRDEPVESMYEHEGKREIILPSNLYIIGTMNTADRSVGHIDYAIKRRFAFADVLPTDQAIDDVIKDTTLNHLAKSLYHKVADLFNEDKNKIVYLQSDFKGKDVQLGHSYFLVETEKQLELKLNFEIKPLLNEYVKDGILSEEALLKIADL